MRTAIYIRVSTEDQAQEGYSISAQKDRLTAFCLSQDWEIYDYYIDDGVSAKDLDRKELQRLLDDAKSDKFDIVLVYKLDRLTRSVLDLYELLNTFEKNNVKFKSATEVYDTTTAMGRLFITLVAALAQWERENLSERVRFGMEQMVREGKRPGGPVPFGYDRDGINVIPEEKQILRELRRLYMEGNGFRATAKILNQRGLLKREIEWNAQSVYAVLDNPYYAGKLRWGSKKTNGKYASRKKEERVQCIFADGSQEKIFSWEEYLEHTRKMKIRSFYGYTKKREYWFAGVLRCGKCGAAMTGRYRHNKRKDGSYKQILSYICARRQLGQDCTMPMFRQELVEKLVLDHIRQIKIDHDRVRQLSDNIQSEHEHIQKEIEKLHRELEKVRDRKRKWQRMFVDELINEEELREHNSTEREHEAELLERIKAEETKVQKTTHPEHIDLMFDLLDTWNVLDDRDKNELIQTIFESIELDTPLETAKGVARKGKFIPSYIKAIEYR